MRWCWNHGLGVRLLPVLCTNTGSPLVNAKQPILLNEEKNLWTVRKLTELPYCLARCGRIDELKELLTNYSWLDACVRTMPCADIINWFSDVIPVVPLGR